MIRTLLATTALAVTLGGLPRPAAAQSGPGLATFDFAQATNALATVQKLKDQWETLKSSLTQLEGLATTQTNMLNAIQHGNAVMSIARGLMNTNTQLPGLASGAVPGATFGAGLQGEQAQRFYSQNHVYTPTNSDFYTQELERRQQATANMQGDVQTGIETADGRVSMLNEMLYDIQNNNDPTYLAAAQAHIASEQSFLANEQTKIQRLQLAQATQAQVDQQRVEQHQRQELDEMHTQASAAAGW